MPTSGAAPCCDRKTGAPRCSAARAALAAATLLALTACIPQQQPGDAVGPKTPAATTSTASGKPSAPITTEKLSAPVALAPEITKSEGGSKPSPPASAAKPAPGAPVVTAPPIPVSTRTAAATPPAPAKPPEKPLATASAVGAPSTESKPTTSCPPGTVGMWSKDVIGSEVYICRSLHPQP